MAELIASEILPTGTWVMLSDDAPLDWQLLVGSEAVLRTLFTGARIETLAGGDLYCHRLYCCEHQHRGRLIMDIPEEFLTVVSPEVGKGQTMIHNEMTRELCYQLFPEGL